MKQRNNYNIGKIGTIIDKRCSFCIVHLDNDNSNKNYNYGTSKIQFDMTHEYVDLGLPSGTLWATLEQTSPKITETTLYGVRPLQKHPTLMRIASLLV